MGNANISMIDDTFERNRFKSEIKAALKNKVPVVPGGGFHHCSSDKGGGFCAYADITLAIKVTESFSEAWK